MTVIIKRTLFEVFDTHLIGNNMQKIYKLGEESDV